MNQVPHSSLYLSSGNLFNLQSNRMAILREFSDLSFTIGQDNPMFCQTKEISLMLILIMGLGSSTIASFHLEQPTILVWRLQLLPTSPSVQSVTPTTLTGMISSAHTSIASWCIEPGYIASN